MTKKRLSFILALAVLAFLVLQGPAQVTAAPPQQQATLNNASFEDPYAADGAAQGWGRWHEDTGAASKPEECAGRYAFRPQWSRETNSSIVLDGFVSQHVGNQFDTWHAGVYQNVAVTPGTTYRFSFFATGRANNEQYPAPSNTEVNMGVRAGIDPNGSGLWNDADIVWGSAGSPHMSGGQGNWQQFTVEATATGNQITVFASADFTGANQCRGHLDIWFDRAELVTAQPAEPPTNTPPPPQPTNPAPPPPPPPAATNTPEPEPTEDATPTDTPEPTATPTETPIPGGTICVNAFADSDADGQRDEEEEGAMAGVTLSIVNSDGELAGEGVSSGPEPICFEGLPPGEYEIAQRVPPALEMTTAANVELDITEGQQVLVEFGSRIRPEQTATAVAEADDTEATPGPEDEEPAGSGAILPGGGNNTLAIAGIAALCLAVLVLGGLVFALVRSRPTV